MTDTRSFVESRFAKLKEHVENKLRNRATEFNGKPITAAIRNEFVGWLRSVAVERKYRMIESFDNNRLKINSVNYSIIKKQDGSLDIYNTSFGQISHSSITTLVKNLVSASTSNLLIKLQDECSTRLADELNISKKRVSDLLTKFHQNSNPQSRSVYHLPKSLKLLNNLDVAGELCALAKTLWDSNFFSREILSLTVKIFGFPGRIDQYNWVAANYELLKKLQKENPVLCCLLSYSAVKGKSIGGEHSLPRDGTDYLQYGDRAYQMLKLRCKEYGLTDAGWKWLCKQGSWFFNDLQLRAGNTSFISECAMKNIGKIPKTKHLNLFIRNESRLKTSITVKFLEQLANKKVKASDSHLHHLVLDYAEQNLDDLKPCKLTWETLMRLQERWHRDQHAGRTTAKKGMLKTWVSVLPKYELKTLAATELVSNHELIDEGDAMRHCVGGDNYVSACANGQSAIFSIKNSSGERVATVELTQYGQRYVVRQCYGPENLPVSPSVHTMARKLAAEYTAQAKKAAQKGQYLQAA